MRPAVGTVGWVLLDETREAERCRHEQRHTRQCGDTRAPAHRYRRPDAVLHDHLHRAGPARPRVPGRRRPAVPVVLVADGRRRRSERSEVAVGSPDPERQLSTALEHLAQSPSLHGAGSCRSVSTGIPPSTPRASRVTAALVAAQKASSTFEDMATTGDRRTGAAIRRTPSIAGSATVLTRSAEQPAQRARSYYSRPAR